MASQFEASEQPDATPAQSQQMSALLRLRALLLEGEFKPGQRMAELPLAARLNVSRTPLRLALLALEHEGLLEMHSTRGFIVRAFSLLDIYDAIELRGLLEGMAGRLAVERLPLDTGVTRDRLAPLHACAKALEEVMVQVESSPETGLARYIEINDRFHALLLELANSRTLEREMQHVTGLPFASPSGGFVDAQAGLADSRHILRIGQDQHNAIVEAIEGREAARTESLLREHSRLARRNLEIVIADRKLHHLVPGVSLIQDTTARRATRELDWSVIVGSGAGRQV